jgi:hypothetical protein
MNHNSDPFDNIFYFLFVVVPFFILPLSYIGFKLNKSIQNIRFKFASSPKNDSKKFIRHLLIRQFGILLIGASICSITVLSFVYETHFILKFIFLVAVLPAIMVVISLFAGLGKAFEAGFNSSTLLNTLDDLSKKNMPNQKIKQDE